MENTRLVGSGRGLRRSVRAHLYTLGDTPTEISEHLVAQRVRGVPGLANDCAIARYLQAVVGAEGHVQRVVVTERRLKLSLRGRRAPILVRLPRPMSSFIQAFDAGLFPELVDQEKAGPRPVAHHA